MKRAYEQFVVCPIEHGVVGCVLLSWSICKLDWITDLQIEHGFSLEEIDLPGCDFNYGLAYCDRCVCFRANRNNTESIRGRIIWQTDLRYT